MAAEPIVLDTSDQVLELVAVLVNAGWDGNVSIGKNLGAVRRVHATMHKDGVNEFQFEVGYRVVPVNPDQDGVGASYLSYTLDQFTALNAVFGGQ